MASSIGSLVVSLGLDAASFITGLDKSDKAAKSFSNGLAAIGKGLAALGAGAFLTTTVKSFIDAADKLNDLRTITGLTGNELLVLQGAAARGGLSIEDTGKIITKFIKQLSTMDEEGSKSAAMLRKLGINPDPNQNILQFLTKIGAKFREYEDGANKAIGAQIALGKGGDRLIPVIEGLDEMSKRAKQLGLTISEDTITAADKFNDTLEDLKAVWFVMSGQLAEALLPHLQKFAEWMIQLAQNGTETKASIDSLFTSLKALASIFVGVTTAIQVAGEAAFLFFKLADFLVGNNTWGSVADEVSISFESMAKRINDAKKSIAEINSETDRTFSNVKSGHSSDVTKARKVFPKVPDPAGAKKYEDALKKHEELLTKITLDAIKDRTQREQDILDDAHKDFSIGDAEYFRKRLALQETSFSAELAAMDKNLARLRGELSNEEKKGQKTKDYLDALGNVLKAEADRKKLVDDNTEAQRKLGVEQDRVNKKYLNDIAEISTTLLEMEGRTAEAARRRMEMQTRDLRAQAAFRGDTGAVGDIDKLRARSDALERNNELNTAAGEIQTRLGIQTDRIERARMSEIDRLNAVSDANARAADQMRRVVMEKEQLARDFPGLKQLALDAEIARNELEKLESQTHLLADVIEEEFASAAADAFTDFIDGTKTAKEAFNDFQNSVIKAINRMVAEALSKKLMGALGMGDTGGGAGGSGFGDFMAGLFGSGRGFGSLFGGSSAASAASDFAGGGFSGLIGAGSSLSFLPSFASGVDFVPRDMLAKIHRGERVMTADENRHSDRPISQVFNFAAPTERRTQEQVSAQAGKGVQRALDRVT